jgi:hypothetical protein
VNNTPWGWMAGFADTLGDYDPWGKNVAPQRKPENLESHRLASESFFGAAADKDVNGSYRLGDKDNAYYTWFSSMPPFMRSVAAGLEAEMLESVGVMVPGPSPLRAAGKGLGMIAGKVAPNTTAVVGGFGKMLSKGATAKASRVGSAVSDGFTGVGRGIQRYVGSKPLVAKQADKFFNAMANLPDRAVAFGARNVVSAEAKKLARAERIAKWDAEDEVVKMAGGIPKKGRRVAAAAFRTMGDWGKDLSSAIYSIGTKKALDAVGATGKRATGEFSVGAHAKLNFRLEQRYAALAAEASFHHHMAQELRNDGSAGGLGRAFLTAIPAAVQEGMLSLGFGGSAPRRRPRR